MESQKTKGAIKHYYNDFELSKKDLQRVHTSGRFPALCRMCGGLMAGMQPVCTHSTVALLCPFLGFPCLSLDLQCKCNVNTPIHYLTDVTFILSLCCNNMSLEVCVHCGGQENGGVYVGACSCSLKPSSHLFACVVLRPEVHMK